MVHIYKRMLRVSSVYLFLLILSPTLSLLFSCNNPKSVEKGDHANSKRIELFYSLFVVDDQNAVESDFSEIYRYDGERFFIDTPRFITEKEWEVLISSLSLLEKDVMDSKNPYKQEHNYCENLQADFYIGDTLINRMCIHPDHKRLRQGDEIYMINDILYTFFEEALNAKFNSAPFGKIFGRQEILVK